MRERSCLSTVTPYKVPSVTRGDKIRMDSNESALRCSPRVIQALHTLTSEQISCYPEPLTLVEDIARHSGVEPENILLTNGADDAIRAIMDTFCNPGDQIILPVPTFSMFELLARMREASIKKITYKEDFSFPVEGVCTALTEEPALIIIVSPNNPTGTSIEADQLHTILESAPNSLIVLDETYHHFGGTSYVDCISDHDNLIVLQSFSKAYGLAGIRLGVIFSSSPVISSIRKVMLPYPVSVPAVVAGRAALGDQSFLTSAVDTILTEKRFLASQLEKLNVRVRRTDTNFLLVYLGDGAQDIAQKLETFNILIKLLTDYESLSPYARITVRTRSENISFINALKSILPPEALLFDMDGVLVDVSESYIRTIQETAEHFLTEPVTLEEIQQYKEKGGYNNDWNLTEALITSRGVHVEKTAIITQFQDIYQGIRWDGRIHHEQWLLDEDIIQALRKTLPLGIVTGRPRDEALYTLERFGMKDCFEVLIALEDVRGQQKPHPCGIQKALDTLQVKRAVYVGDTIDDIRAACAAGVLPIGIVSPDDASRAESFSRAGAVHLIPTVNTIMEVLQ